jgi:hypothetical protein
VALANGGYYSEHAQSYDVLRKKGVTGPRVGLVRGNRQSKLARTQMAAH